MTGSRRLNQSQRLVLHESFALAQFTSPASALNSVQKPFGMPTICRGSRSAIALKRRGKNERKRACGSICGLTEMFSFHL